MSTAAARRSRDPNARRSVVAVLLILMGCSHEITVEPIDIRPQATSRQPSVVLVLSEATRTFASSKLRGTDIWSFPLGEAVTRIAPQAFAQDFREVRVIFGFTGDVPAGPPSPVVRLEIAAFELTMGIFQWSRHEAEVRLTTTVLNAQGRQIWTGEVSGHGTSSAATQEIAYVPVVGNTAFDRALSVAMTNAVLEASRKASSSAANSVAVPMQPTPGI